MAEEDNLLIFKKRQRHFAEILNPLFDPTPFMRSDRLFEFLCVLVRSGGAHGQGWDPWYESQATLDDLGNLSKLNLPAEQFPEPQRTRIRLALLSYCHITEMDLPYSLMANLLRLRLGAKYDIEPFRDLFVPLGKKRHPLGLTRPPSPTMKIGRIRKLADEANLPAVPGAFDSFYDSVIRNAVYHSDYTLVDSEFRLLRAYRLSKKTGINSPVVEREELFELINDAFAFYTALFALYERCRKSFGDFKHAFVPFDLHYKGLLQLLFDDEQRLIGFRAYWPNESFSEYTRTKNGSGGQNIVFDPDGSINFMVGLYASKPGKFSPLVEYDAQPKYAEVPGTTIRPHWPEKLQVYKAPIDTEAAKDN
jgi:hypothetical protein